MKSKSLILMVVSLGFGLIAAVGISQVMGSKNSQQPVLQTGPVIVPAEDLGIGELLTEENCKILDYPIRLIPEGAVTSIDQIKDMATRGRLPKDMPFLVTQIIGKNERGVLPIPKGKKVCSIKVSAADTIDGLLQPGDRIDLIGIFKVRRNNQNLTTAKTFLKNITVFSAAGKTTFDGNRQAGGGKSSIISVLVTPQQAEMLLLVQKSAQLSVVMRGPEAQDEPEGVSDEDFLSKFFRGDDLFADDDKEEKVVKSAGGTMQDFLQKALTRNKAEKKTMRIWKGSEPVMFTFGREGELPTSDEAREVPPKFPGSQDGAAAPNAGVAPGSNPGTEGSLGGPSASNSNGNTDFNRSTEIDRSLEEDQYPGE